MCVDNYQFRHYSSVKEKKCRRFVFINEDQIQKVFLVNISQFQQNGEVALCKILFHLGSKGLPITNRKFYMPKYNISIQPGDYCKVPFQALSDKQIIFYEIIKDKSLQILNPQLSLHINTDIQQCSSQNKQQTDDFFTQIQNCSDCTLENNQNYNCLIENHPQKQQNLQNQSYVRNDDIQTKRIKQPERQIRQVIMAVKKWRKLYQSKKLNLIKAAKVIGISKKSLDDYYLVLRVGQILGFDYQPNLNDKMGDLRAYIRTFDYKVTGKLTKYVKCFELVPQVQIDLAMQQQN